MKQHVGSKRAPVPALTPACSRSILAPSPVRTHQNTASGWASATSRRCWALNVACATASPRIPSGAAAFWRVMRRATSV